MTWEDTLKQAGWPTAVLVLDFENYYDSEYQIKKLSVVEFVKSPKFAFLGVGYGCLFSEERLRILGCTLKPGTDKSELSTGFIDGPDVADYIAMLQLHHGRHLEKITLVMANAKYDTSILKYHFGITPPYIVDIQDLARSQDARERTAVEHLATMYKVGEKGKELKALVGKHWDDLTEEDKINLRTYGKNDVDLEAELFQLLLPRLSRPEVELPFARHTLKMFLNPRFLVDITGATELIKKMKVAITEAITPTGCTSKQISGNISFKELLTNAMPEGEKIPMKMGGGKTPKLILAIAKVDPERDILLYHLDDKVRNLMEARIAIKSWPLHIKRITRLIAQAKVSGGLLGMPLKYHGAHTGRHSGEQNINPTNFSSRGEGLAQEIKHILKPVPPGRLVIGDQAQIEARMTAVLSGQSELVEDFRQGKDIYSQFATRLFGNPVRKPQPSDPEPVAKLLFTRRFIGKQAILGLGYGMGEDRFFKQVQQEVMGRELIKTGKFTPGTAKTAVRQYRSQFNKIIEFWDLTEGAFKFVVRYSGQSYRLEESDLLFESSGDTVWITLPSGRKLRYPNCYIVAHSQLKWKWGHLWGGTIVENIVQAASRDVLAEQILEIERRGYDMLLPVYDSTVTWAGKDRIEECFQDVKEIMSTPPTWRPDLPVAVDIEIVDQYQ